MAASMQVLGNVKVLLNKSNKLARFKRLLYINSSKCRASLRLSCVVDNYSNNHMPLQKTFFTNIVRSRSCIFASFHPLLWHYPHNQPLHYSTQVGNTSADSAEQLNTVKSDENSQKDEKQSKEKQKKFKNWTGKNVWKLGLVFLGGYFGLTCVGLVYIWGAPPLDPSGKLLQDEFSDDIAVLAYTKRALKEANIYRQMIQDPSSEKLLPDPLQEPYFQPPYTLVIEMTGVLVHPDWTYGTGWRFKKRPNVDSFLQQIGPPLFEVVIYTSEQAYTAFPLIDSLDPQGYIMYRLFRDATRYIEGHHVKDLSCLNRDLSKVIIIDWDPKSYNLQPRNAVNMKKWVGNDDDSVLPDLAHFLRTIAVNGVQDVREVLDYYNQYDDPIFAFKEKQRTIQEEQQRIVTESEQKKSSSLFSPWSRRKL